MRDTLFLVVGLSAVALCGCADVGGSGSGDDLGGGQWVGPSPDAGGPDAADLGLAPDSGRPENDPIVDAGPGSEPNMDDTGEGSPDAPQESPDVGPSPDGTAPGGRCGCDADCAAHEGRAGRCVTGVCMMEASGACSSRGARDECPSGGRCWPLRNFEDEPICWPDCDAFSCDGTCDDDGSCAPLAGWDCDASCGELCNGGASDRACAPANPRGHCGSGELCDDGVCVTLCGADNPDGFCQAGYACVGGACVSEDGCGDWQCDLGAACDEIVAFPGPSEPTDPDAVALGYFIDTHRDYAFLRRDLVMLTQWATCQMRERFPGIAPLGLADLTQANGRIPGTDVGDARHPDGTHDGSDLDIAYYQTDGVNDAQIICGDGSDRNENGTRGQFNDGRFCTTEQNIVDLEQQVYFMALMAYHGGWRIVGVDTTVADDIEREVDRLWSLDIISGTVRDRLGSLGYGSAGGWAFHHHHIHVSYYD